MQRRAFLKRAVLAFSLPYLTKTGSAKSTSQLTKHVFENTYFSAAKNPSGQFSIQQINNHGIPQFSSDLPSRGHSFAVSSNNYLVAIGRRPSNYFLVINLRNARSTLVNSEVSRRFYGHGVFSPGGKHLYLTENDLHTGMGKVGVYDVLNEFKKIKEFSSFGIGPHDIAFDRQSLQLVVANGGIKTHPATGRKKLNINSMRSSLVHIDPLSGELTNRVQLPQELRFNSIRHLTIDNQGDVYVSLQNQKFDESQCLLAIFRSKIKTITSCVIPGNVEKDLNHYLGDITLDCSEQYFMTTSPRGDRALIFDREGGFLDSVKISDVCGVAKTDKVGGFRVTSGDGQMVELVFNRHSRRLQQQAMTELQTDKSLSWDNHLIFVDSS